MRKEKSIKMKQKGFISIPIIIAIIVSVIAVSTATTGVILHKQGKLTPLVASISQVFKGTKDTEPEVKPEEPQAMEEQPQPEETNQKETSQQKQELEQAKLEAEKAKQEAEKAEAEAKVEAEKLKAEQETQRLTEEQRRQELKKIAQSEIYRKNILDIINLVKEEAIIIQGLEKKGLEATENRIDSLNDMINRNSFLFINNPSVLDDIRNVAKVFDELYKIDLRMTTSFRDDFKRGIEILDKSINTYKQFYDNALNRKEIITEEEYKDVVSYYIKEYSALGEIRNYALEFIDSYLDWVEDTDQNYKDALVLVKTRYSSSYYQIPQTYRIELYESFSPYDSLINNFYKQEQIRALNRISDELNNIWYELRY